MSCHESLMARRRKKSKAAAQARAREKDNSPMITDKSLPALPPNAIPPNAFSNDRVDPESDTPTELSPRPRAQYNKTESSSRSSSRPDRSPERNADASQNKESGLTLPKASYRNNRNSSIIAQSNDSSGGDGESFFIPLALDPSPVNSATPRSTSDGLGDPQKKSDKDYFSVSRAGSEKKDSQSSTPHIAFQDKGRQASSDHDSPPVKPPMRKLSKTARHEANALAKTSPAIDEEKSRKPSNGKTSIDEFKLQDAPKSKKLISPRTPSQSSNNLESGSGKGMNGITRKERLVAPGSESAPHLSAPDKPVTPRSSQDLRLQDDEDVPTSTDSVSSSRTDGTQQKPIPRKELPRGTTINRK